MMPEMDGQQALRGIRDIEAEHGRRGLDGAKVVMTTALGDGEHVMTSFREQCDGYLVKPIIKPKLMDLLQNLGLPRRHRGRPRTMRILIAEDDLISRNILQAVLTKFAMRYAAVSDGGRRSKRSVSQRPPAWPFSTG
jgi:CheY-like chemotaxis protein